MLILAACTLNTTKHKIQPAGESGRKENKAKVYDTAMLPLKSLGTIAVNDLLSQDWDMEDADRKHWNEFFWDSVQDKRRYPGLSLFKDFTFTENIRCAIKMGRWSLNKETRQLLLRFDDGSQKMYFIEKLSLSKIAVTWKREDDEVTLRFSSDGLVHKQPVKDPYYPANNKWRIRPAVSESNEQIRQRLKDCVHFYSLFFKDNRLRQQTDISFIGLPNCFVWYNGGIGLPSLIELDNKWKDCFYSEDQALKGYDMLKRILEKHELIWPKHAASWVDETQEVLEQLRDKL